MRKLIFCFLFLPTVMMAEDGSQLWLRYEKLDKTQVNLSEQSTTMNIAAGELRQYYRGGKVTLAIDKTLTANLGDDGYIIRNDSIIATTDIGVLYGTYALLRMQHTHPGGYKPMVCSVPSMALRLLNHWDNLDGSIERGYAGKSILCRYAHN